MVGQPMGQPTMARVRTKVPLLWSRRLRRSVRVGAELTVVEVDLVIASTGEWRKLMASGGRAWSSLGSFGPFRVGTRWA